MAGAAPIRNGPARTYNKVCCHEPLVAWYFALSGG
jgi:hypothetical protein